MGAYMSRRGTAEELSQTRGAPYAQATDPPPTDPLYVGAPTAGDVDAIATAVSLRPLTPPVRSS